MDETWLYHYDPETKQQSMGWRHSDSPRPKNSKRQNPLEKFSPLIFWDQEGIFLIDYLPKGRTINAEHYLSLTVQLKDILEEKCWLQKGHQGGLVLAQQCPGSPGTCNPEETGLPGLPVSWSPTLFSGSGPIGLKKQLRGRHFSSDTEVIAAAENWLDGQPSEFSWVACIS